MALQILWFALLTHKMFRTPSADPAEIVQFASWSVAVLAFAFWWSIRPGRRVIFGWQLSNLVGSIWMFFHIKEHATNPLGLANTVSVMLSVLCLLSLSGIVALWCLPRVENAASLTLGWKIPFLAVGASILASPLLQPFVSHGSAFLVIVVVAMLLVSLVDPRPLIGLAIAIVTPLVAVTVSLASANTGIGTSLRLAALSVGVMVVVSMRVRTLVRRLVR